MTTTLQKHDMVTDRKAVIKAHENEAKQKGAKILNHGWVQSDTGIASKTTFGVLCTDIATDGKITHEWSNRRR